MKKNTKYSRPTSKKSLPQSKRGRNPKQSNISPVVLPQLFGIQPEVYLLIFFFVMLGFVLWGLIFLPGIIHRGSQTQVWTEVSSVEFSVDGVQFGAVPERFFIPSGDRHLELRKTGFLPYSEVHRIPGRIFLSLFFPHRSDIRIRLQPDTSISPEKFRKDALLDLAFWGFYPLQTEAQIPPIYDDYAVSLLQRNPETINEEPIPELGLIGNRAQLQDIIRGQLRLQSKSKVVNSFGLSRLINEAIPVFANADSNVVREIIGLVNETPQNFSSTDSQITERNNTTEIPIELIFQILESYIQAYTNTKFEEGSSPTEQLTNQLATTLQGLGYNGRLTQVSNSESRVFLVMDSPVNFGFFQNFMDDSQLWNFEMAKKLEERGLSTANRFLQNPLGKPTNTNLLEPVNSVNLLAIYAFIRWVNEELQEEFAVAEFAENNFEFLKIGLPSPSELSAYYNNSSQEELGWEYTSQFGHIHQSNNRDIGSLEIEEQEIFALQEALLGGEALELNTDRLAKAPIQVQNSLGELGILSPRDVSPITTFRLVFEVSRESAQ